MPNPQANVAAFNAARSAVLNHPMCLRLLDEGSRMIVVYPDGDFPVDGVRVPRSAHGLGLALAKMEEHWRGSYPAQP